MASTLDSKGNVVTNGYSTNLTPEQSIPAYDLQSFKKANPNLQFTVEDFNHYNDPNSSVYKPTSTSAIPISSVTTAPQPQFQIPPQTTNTDYNGITTGAANKFSYDVQQQDQALKNSVSDFSQLQDALLGEKAFTAQQNEKFGVNAKSEAYKRKLTELNNLSLQAAEAQQGNISQGRELGSVGSFVAGQANEIERNRSMKALRLSSEAAILKDDLDLAKSAAAEAVDLEYAPIKQQLANKEKMFEMNKVLLANATEKEKTAYARAQDALAREQKKIDQDIADKKEISNLITDAIPNAPKDIIEKAKKLQESGASKVAVAQALGKYGGDYLGNLVKLSTIAKNNKDYEKTVEEIKALKTPLQNNAPVGSNAHSTNSWVNSAVNKESLSAGEREKISKSFAVVGQLGNLATALQKDQTSFFGGKVREIKASLGADANAGAIQAQITALVPQVARGTFGEVGVLTDADISNYKKVIGNLSSPNAQNAAVTAMTLTALRNGVKSQLDTAAASKLDVSRFVPMYQDLTNQINQINDEIGVSDQQVRSYMLKNPQTQPMIEALILEGRKGSEILQILGVEN